MTAARPGLERSAGLQLRKDPPQPIRRPAAHRLLTPCTAATLAPAGGRNNPHAHTNGRTRSLPTCAIDKSARPPAGAITRSELPAPANPRKDPCSPAPYGTTPLAGAMSSPRPGLEPPAGTGTTKDPGQCMPIAPPVGFVTLRAKGQGRSSLDARQTFHSPLPPASPPSQATAWAFDQGASFATCNPRPTSPHGQQSPGRAGTAVVSRGWRPPDRRLCAHFRAPAECAACPATAAAHSSARSVPTTI